MDRSHLYLLVAAAAPALLAMWLVDRLDRKRPEPASLRRKVAVFGALSVIPVLIIDAILLAALRGSLEPDFTYNGAMFKAFIAAAAVEELCKVGVIYWIVWRRPEFDERLDGIVYASRAGLGFAFVENVLYVMVASGGGMEHALTVAGLRAVLAVPGHAMWSAMIGYFAARRRFDRKGPGFIGGYLLAVAMHGAYDYAIFAQAPLRLEGHGGLGTGLLVVPLLLTVIAFLIVRAMARTALALDDAQHAQTPHPPPGPGPTPSWA